MAKLTTSDHVAAIIAVLSTDNWLADRAWEMDRHACGSDEITLPDRVTDKGDGLVMIEVAPKAYVKTDRPLWKDRASWDANFASRLAPPFAKTHFKRQSKKKVADEIVREFSTPALFITAVTYERNHAIDRIEFVQVQVQDWKYRRVIVRTVASSEIPAHAAVDQRVPLTYDVLDAATLEARIMQAALDWMVAEEDYASHQDVIDDYSPKFGLDEAVHNAWPISKLVESDVSTVEFDNENTEVTDFDAPQFQGVNTIGDFTFVGVMAGGDWEAPVVFILYVAEGQVRAYVPVEGNHYDHKNMRAWGNGDSEHDEEKMEEMSDADWDVKALRLDISRRFGLG